MLNYHVSTYLDLKGYYIHIRDCSWSDPKILIFKTRKSQGLPLSWNSSQLSTWAHKCLYRKFAASSSNIFFYIFYLFLQTIIPVQVIGWIRDCRGYKRKDPKNAQMTNFLLAGKGLMTPIMELTLLTMSIGEHSMRTPCLSLRLQIKVQVCSNSERRQKLKSMPTVSFFIGMHSWTGTVWEL